MGNIEIEFEELEEELEIELAEENGLPLGFYDGKNDLKNVANEHGGEITDETPFADYAPEFDRVIKSKAENVTAELEKTQAELTETQGKLTATERELSETKSTLETTRGELADTKEDLEEAIAAQITARPLTVTENGTYTANEKEAFNPVTVNVGDNPLRNYINGYFDLCTPSKKKSAERLFASLNNLTEVTNEDFPFHLTSGFTNFMYMFYYCGNLTKVPLFDTKDATGTRDMFNNCHKLKVIPAYDLRNVTGSTIQSMFNRLLTVEEIWIRNIGASYTVGSGTTYGHLLTLESLLHLIKELRNMGASRILTVGSANLEKLANVYVRFVEITDEMRADDDLIDEKLPFEVCESTDEGACSIIEYVSYKNWEIQ